MAFNPIAQFVPFRGWCIVHNVTKHRISPYFEYQSHAEEYIWEKNLDIDNQLSHSDDDLYDALAKETRIDNQHNVQVMD